MVSLAVKDSLVFLEDDLQKQVKTLIFELTSLYDHAMSEDISSLEAIKRAIAAVDKIETKVGRLHNTFSRYAISTKNTLCDILTVFILYLLCCVLCCSFRESSANLFGSYPYLNGTPEIQSKRTKHAVSDKEEVADKLSYYTTPTGTKCHNGITSGACTPDSDDCVGVSLIQTHRGRQAVTNGIFDHE